MFLWELYYHTDMPISTFLFQRALFSLELYIICILASVIHVNQMKRGNRKDDVTDQQLRYEIQNVKKSLLLLATLVLILDLVLVIMALTV